MLTSVIGIAGTVLSLVGVVIAILQIRKTRKAAEAAERAADETRNAVLQNASLADIARAVAVIDEIKSFVRGGRYEAALLRVTDLHGRLLQQGQALRSASRGPMTQLQILRDRLERRLQDATIPVDVAQVNETLSQVSDQLNIWLGQQQYATTKGDAGADHQTASVVPGATPED